MKKILLGAGLLLSGLVFWGCGNDAAPQSDPLASVKLPADTEVVMSVHGLNADRAPVLDAWGKAFSKLIGADIDLNKLLEAQLAELPKPDAKTAEWLTLFDINAQQGTTGIRSLSVAVTPPKDPDSAEGMRAVAAVDGDGLDTAKIIDRALAEFEANAPKKAKEDIVIERTSPTSVKVSSDVVGMKCCLTSLQGGKGLTMTAGEAAKVFLDANSPMARAFLPMPNTDLSVRIAVANLEKLEKYSEMMPDNPVADQLDNLPNVDDVTAVDASLGLRGTELCLYIRTEYKDAKAVAEMEKDYKTQFAQGLESMSEQMPNLKPLAELLKTNLRPTFSGKVLTVTLTLTPEEFEKAVAPALKELQTMLQGMFGGTADR